MAGAAIIAGGKTSEVLQLVEAALDAVALAVDTASCGMIVLRLRFDGITTFMPAATPMN